ncbi:hypothetical protein PR003_g26707 [Phytophthora rubi]|uniref:Uncharacterized protein n=1 Tax=Phytophthora rubi TaxID=129364 RepID=A0A6A4C6T1_9STRA|nr:hypothetical protein PR001_g25416 [Phytophthora rubi]KAE9284998.1 hypothetical protein PR003_g26707 [Phytophthora rubi]
MPANLYQVEDAFMPPVVDVLDENAGRFCFGADAVPYGAGHVSASVFDHPLLGTAESARTQAAKLSARARVVRLKIRPGSADAVRGALAVCAFLAALIPSQTLPLFQPSLFQLARGVATSAPAVFHVTSEAILRGMTVTGSFEPFAHENGKAVAAAKLVSGNARTIQTTGDNATCSDYIAHESGVVTSNSRGIVRDMVSMEIKKLVWHGMDSKEGKDQLVVKHLVKQGEDMKRCDQGPGGVHDASDTRPHPQRNDSLLKLRAARYTARIWCRR